MLSRLDLYANQLGLPALRYGRFCAMHLEIPAGMGIASQRIGSCQPCPARPASLASMRPGRAPRPPGDHSVHLQDISGEKK